MSTRNQSKSLAPYRSPGLAPTPEHDALRLGRYVVLPLESGRVPDRCVICNRSAELYRAVVELDEQTTIEVPLCAGHRKQAAWGRRMIPAGIVIAVAGFLQMFVFESVWLFAVALVLGLLLLLSGNALRKVVRLRWGGPGKVLVRAGKPFLSSIPALEEGGHI